MGVSQSRLLLVAFMGLSAFIACNAVYWQEGPHPAPFSTDVSALNGASRAPTASIRRGARRTARQPAGARVSSETVRAIQRELTARGYDPGPVDGVHGLLTRAAVMAFQHDNRIGVTGEPSEALLKRILLGVGASAQKNETAVSVPKETVGLIRAVQHILAKLGYDPGPVDGVMGAGTRRAIRTFEEEQKMTAGGRISGRLLKALIRVTGADLANIKAG